MAAAPRQPDKQKLIELKKEIEELLAVEGGKIDAGTFKDKYQKHFGKKFSLPKKKSSSKLTTFLQNHMSDVVEISKDGTTSFVEAKSKRKEAVAENGNSGKSRMPEREEWPELSGLKSRASTHSSTVAVVPPLMKVQHFSSVPQLSNHLPPVKLSNGLSQFQRRQQHIVGPVQDVKTEVKKIIAELAKEHHVHVEMVTKRLFERFKVSKAEDLGYRRNDIPGIKELVRKQREINASIQGFVMVRSVSTLRELGQYLASLYPEAREFEDLQVGPLVKQPLVYEYFKFPVNQEPPDITTLTVMKYLKQFMSKMKLWASKVELKEFLEYLTEQMSCNSPYELGVKIESVALMIAAIKRCQRAECDTRKEAEAKLNEEIAEEVEQYLQKYRRRLLGKQQSGLPDPDALVNNLVDLSPVEILTKVFEYCAVFFQGKVKKNVEAFVETCTRDKTCRKLFQLTVHHACRDLVKPVDDLSHQPISYSDTASLSLPEEFALQSSPPAKEGLLSEVRQWLVKGAGSMDLKFLARVEEHILQKYQGFQAFTNLGHGPFLQLLSQHEDLSSLISPSDRATDGGLGGIRKTDIIDLIQQCDVDMDNAKVVRSVRAQYTRLNNSFVSRSLNPLIAKARQQGSQQGLTSRKVVYEACLVVETLERRPDEERSEHRSTGILHVGSLGYQDESKALMCLYQTPLLGDYAVWSNWDHVFAPMYGNLKLFLRKDHRVPEELTNNGFCINDLIALETTTGCLVRVTRCTSMEQFLKYAKNGDTIGTSGHVVSLVLEHGGVEKAPLALLANHMREAFLFLSSQQHSTSEHVEEFVVKFAIRSLKRIPDLMRAALAKQVFIEPLMHVFGNVKTPDLVLEHCETYEEKSMVHYLGIRLGITQWQEDFRMKLTCSVSKFKVVDEKINTTVVEEQTDALKRPSDTKDAHQSSEHTHDSADSEEIASGDEEKQGNDLPGRKTVKSEEPNEGVCEKEQHCRVVVESIRREEFGIGIELPPEHRHMVDNQRQREGRGLHRLSSELYSKDTHFVLELVQNADDNRYPDQSCSDEPPSIAFFVNIDKIVVFNNEIGFEEKNIRALCDVGKSTKGKQRYGYIGQKGIGFKSVFRITDTPEVHSNGYHIKFDAKSGPTGYILPHWHEPSDEDRSLLNLDWTTRIVLTLRDEMKTVQKKTLIARFHDIQPSLLLFLRRLRQIKIMDEVSKTSREMLRRDVGENLIELKHSNGVDLWFVVKKELPASSMKADIETTEIALAFPLPKSASAHSVILKDVAAHIHAKMLIQQPVFAFLPLRSYGFRFIVQADFDVPSSREDVDKDSAWNQWLRHEISGLFVQAFDDFRNHHCFDGVASIAQLLQFIPLEDEILDFFKPVTRTIIERICRKQCIPVREEFSSNESVFDCIVEGKSQEKDPNGEQLQETKNTATESLPSDKLKWAFPSQVVVAEDHLIKELINDKVLSCCLNKYYLHPDLQPFVNTPLRNALEIETLCSRHLIDIGKTVASNLTSKLEAEQSEVHSFAEEFSCWVAKWLYAVYRSLEREHDCSEETLQEIASINLYPLSSGHYTCLSGQPVFLPLEETVKDEQTTTKASKKAAKIVHKDLRSLHSTVLESLDDIGRSQVKKLLERLQVRCLTSRDLIKHHIIPSLQSNQNKMVKPEDVLFNYIVYIKEQWDKDPAVCDLEELRGCALLKTDQGFVNPSSRPVHFTVEYGNETNLKKDFPSVPWTLVDTTYLASASSRASCSSWEKFFSKLGVVHFLAIERKDVCLNKAELSNSVWSSLSEFWPRATGDGRYAVKDYTCSELETLLSDNSRVEELEKLAEILDQTWDEKYAAYAKDVPYLDSQGKVLGQTYSSFFLNLKEKSWFPSRYGRSSREIKRCTPRDIYLEKPEIVNLLGDHALYAHPRLSNQRFLKALGIKTSVKFDTFMGHFMKWVEDSQTEGEQEDSFKTTLQHMSCVYGFMEEHVRGHKENEKFLEDVVRNKSVVFVPNNLNDFESPAQDVEDAVSGQFVATKRVYWSDPSNMMQKSSLLSSTFTQPRRMLHNYYQSGLESFFLTFLKIDKIPTLNEYFNLMEAIASQSSIASALIVDEMTRVYDVVGSKCMKENEDCCNDVNFVKKKLSSLKVFPTLEDKWVSLDDKPLISDDKFLEKLFRADGKANSTRPTVNDGKTDEEPTQANVHFLKMGFQRKPKKKTDDKETKKKDRETEAEKSLIKQNARKFLTKVCGIRSVSECVSREIISTQTSECPALQLFLSKWVPYIQRFLYYKRPDHYEKHLDEGVVDALAKVKCFGATELEVVFRLSTHAEVNVSIKKNCGIEKDESIVIYITDSELRDTSDLIKELASFFAHADQVADFGNFLSLLTQKPEDEVENYMEGQDLELLPEDVQVWNVPEPEIVFASVPELEEEIVPENDPESSLQTEHWRNCEISQADGEPRGLQSWPPKSSAMMQHEMMSKNPSTEQVLTAWPPPAPPEDYAASEMENQRNVEQVKYVQPGRSHTNVEGSRTSDALSLPDPVHTDASTDVTNAGQSHPSLSQFSQEQALNVLSCLAIEPGKIGSGPPRTSPPGVFAADTLPRHAVPRPLTVVDGEISVELEEVSLGASSQMTELRTLPQSANAEEIGRWGEDCVYRLLQQTQDCREDVEVVWVNEIQESGLPYDIIIKENELESIFIEVKSTSTSEKKLLEISSQEIQFACQMKDRFHLYRVNNAGNASDLRVSRLRNLALNLDRKAVQLFIHI